MWHTESIIIAPNLISKYHFINNKSGLLGKVIVSRSGTKKFQDELTILDSARDQGKWRHFKATRERERELPTVNHVIVQEQRKLNKWREQEKKKERNEDKNGDRKRKEEEERKSHPLLMKVRIIK